MIEIFLKENKISCSEQGQCDPTTGFCSCNAGFLGTDCSENDECFAINCMNNGTCFDGSCACTDGWYGPTCSIDEASYDPCEEIKDFCLEKNGRCITDKKTMKASCECKFGFSGEKCVQVCNKFLLKNRSNLFRQLVNSSNVLNRKPALTILHQNVSRNLKKTKSLQKI